MDNQEDVSASASGKMKGREKEGEEFHSVRTQALKNFLVRIKIQM